MSPSDVKNLATLDITSDINHFLRLPLPDDSSLTGANWKTLLSIAKTFREALRYLASAEDLFRNGTATIPGSDEEIAGKDLWCRLCLIVGAYYNHAVASLLEIAAVKNVNVHPIPGIGFIDEREWKIDRSEEEANELSTHLERLNRRSELSREELDQSIERLMSLFQTARQENLIGNNVGELPHESWPNCRQLLRSIDHKHIWPK